MLFEMTWAAALPALVIFGLPVTRFGPTKGWIAAVLLLSSLLAHEAAHIYAAKFTGVRVKALGFNGRGAYIRREPARHPAQEAFIALAGPFSSLFVAGMFYRNGVVGNWLAGLNLLLAVSNLVLPNSDGWRAASSVRHWWRRGECARDLS